MSRESQRFPTDQLSLVARAESFQDPREPPLRIGNWVQLNSGGPRSLVVDIEGDKITIAWDADNRPCEHTFARARIHRVS